MTATEGDQPSVSLPSDDELRAWDWRTELRKLRYSVPYLARRTNRADQTVYQYSSGQSRPSIAWLRSAWQVIRELSES